ncbi:MAG: hypothetical protein A3H91_10845 [Gammaproteobacteria bacterium RIFCSPLOWO2_02_FULL_61_13]|nr:MAG: hypothetical protein A3H91_10845 [Gammaproteobacteria bacterium RIFCSPLOWO2_02_FULL_61_13]
MNGHRPFAGIAESAPEPARELIARIVGDKGVGHCKRGAARKGVAVIQAFFQHGPQLLTHFRGYRDPGLIFLQRQIREPVAGFHGFHDDCFCRAAGTQEQHQSQCKYWFHNDLLWLAGYIQPECGPR